MQLGDSGMESWAAPSQEIEMEQDNSNTMLDAWMQRSPLWLSLHRWQLRRLSMDIHFSTEEAVPELPRRVSLFVRSAKGGDVDEVVKRYKMLTSRLDVKYEPETLSLFMSSVASIHGHAISKAFLNAVKEQTTMTEKQLYGSVLRGLSQSGDHSECEAVLDEVAAKKLKLAPEDLQESFRNFTERGDLKSAAGVERLLQDGGNFTKREVVALFKAQLRYDSVKTAIDGVMEGDRKQLLRATDVKEYNSILLSLFGVKRDDVAVRFFNTIWTRGFEPDLGTFLAMCNCRDKATLDRIAADAAQRFPEETDLWDQLTTAYEELSDAAAVKAIQKQRADQQGTGFTPGKLGLALQRDVTSAVSIFAEWESEKKSVSPTLYVRTMTALVEANKFEDVLNIMNHALRHGKEPAKSMYRMAAKAMIETGREQEVPALFHRVANDLTRVAPKYWAQSGILKETADANCPDLLRSLLQQTQAETLKSNPTTIFYIMRCFANQGLTDDCYLTLALAKEVKFELQASTYYVLMKAHHKKRDPKGARAVLEMMKKEGIEPEKSHYALIAASYMSAEDYKSAVAAYEEGKTAPGEHLGLYERALEAHAVLGAVDKMRAVYSDLLASGHRPQASTWESALKVVVSKHASISTKMNVLRWVREEMAKRKIGGTADTYKYLMQFYLLDRKPEMAIETFNSFLKEDGLAHSSSIYALSFAAARHSQNVSHAKATLLEMEKRKLRLTASMCSSLSVLYARAGRLHEALFYFKKLLAFGKPPQRTLQEMGKFLGQFGDTMFAEGINEALSSPEKLIASKMVEAQVIARYGKQGMLPKAEKVYAAIPAMELNGNVIAAMALAYAASESFENLFRLCVRHEDALEDAQATLVVIAALQGCQDGSDAKGIVRSWDFFRERGWRQSLQTHLARIGAFTGFLSFSEAVKAVKELNDELGPLTNPADILGRIRPHFVRNPESFHEVVDLFVERYPATAKGVRKSAQEVRNDSAETQKP